MLVVEIYSLYIVDSAKMSSIELLIISYAMIELLVSLKNRLESFFCLEVNFITFFKLKVDHCRDTDNDSNTFDE